MQTWAYFYGPIAVLLTLNVIYLGLTSWRLWHQYRDYTGSKLRVLRFKCLLYIKLVLVMGITWIFELISFAVDTKIEELWWAILLHAYASHAYINGGGTISTRRAIITFKFFRMRVIFMI